MSAKLTPLNPAGVPKPASNYAQAVRVEGAARWLVLSGQVGMTPEGEIVEGAEPQLRQTWANILALLDSEGMGPDNIVKVTIFLTSAADVAANRRVRDEVLGGRIVASTLLVVSALAAPEFLVEIEVTAAA